MIGEAFNFDVGYVLRIPKEALSDIFILNIKVNLYKDKGTSIKTKLSATALFSYSL